MIKVALVGCGRIARRHAEILKGSGLEGVSLVSVCDIVGSKAKAFGAKYGVPWYITVRDMLANEEIDIVSVLTESGNHARNVIEISGYGKDIIVEKPMALTIDDADSMIHACDEASVRLFVVKQNRFNVPILKLKEALHQGRFGRLILGSVRVRWCRNQAYYDEAPWRGTWAMDGGVLTNQASHHIDMLEWMMGGIESVFAVGSTALANIEAEDTAVVALKFKNGALGLIEATTATRPVDLEGSISVLGEGGTVEVGGFAMNEMKVWNFVDSVSGDDRVPSTYSVNPPDVYGFGHRAYYEHVVDCIKKNKKHLVDGLEGRKSIELINAIYESMETRKEVFLRFRPKYCRLGG